LILCSAGRGSKRHEELCVKHGVTKLYSFLNDEKAIKKPYSGLKMFIDSGAHSWNKYTIQQVGMKGKKKLPPIRQFAERYLDFVTSNPTFATFVELDCYNVLPYEEISAYADALKNVKNLTYLRVYHLSLDGGSLKVLKDWIDQGYEYIGLGRDALPVYSKIFKLTRDRIKYHGFALTALDILKTYPFYSADSTTPISSVLFGTKLVKGKVIGRDRYKKEKDIYALYDSDRKLDHALKEYKEREIFLTKLWKERGITWK